MALTSRAHDAVTTTGGACLHHLFEEQVARRPDAVALSAGLVSLTYRELDVRARSLADRLRQLGVGPDQVVGVESQRRPEVVAALLAVLKAGGAYLPFDVKQPVDRTTYMLDDAGAVAVVGSGRGARSGPVGDRPFVAFDDEQPPPTAKPVDVRPDNLAYVIYTSGSTGSPKGVAVEHRHIVSSTLARTQFGRTPPTTYLLLVPFTFDAAAQGLYWTLAEGGRLVLVPDRVVNDAPLVADVIRAEQVTHINWLPSLYHLLLDVGGTGLVSRQADQAGDSPASDAARGVSPPRISPASPSSSLLANDAVRGCANVSPTSSADPPDGTLGSLRDVSVGGEAPTPQLVRDHLARLPDTALYNDYGPTETTVWATAHLCGPADGRDGAPVPVGLPVPRTTVMLLDDDLAPVAAGEPGEICVGGAQVARGYVSAPAITARRFVPDPFAEVPGDRMYRSGDFGSRRLDGALDYRGRRDRQVKVRGFRVEPGEVEAALARVAGVREAVVLDRRDRWGEVSLVGFVTVDGADLDAAAVRSAAARWLPEHMVPVRVTVVDRLPRSTHGKIDRAALLRDAGGAAGG